MKLNEKRLVVEGLTKVKSWSEYQAILCFLRLWRREYDNK
jgi:hypothetical protein